MRKIILNVAVSLDFMIEGPNGEYDWCFVDQDYGMAAFMQNVDGMFLGRKSYELLMKVDPKSFPGLKRYVFSTTLKAVTNAELISGDALKEVKQIIESDGKDIWLFGGASLTRFFINHNLIDEMALAVHPLILGKGKPLFQSIDERKKFTLKKANTFDSGLVQLIYSK